MTELTRVIISMSPDQSELLYGAYSEYVRSGAEKPITFNKWLIKCAIKGAANNEIL